MKKIPKFIDIVFDPELSAYDYQKVFVLHRITLLCILFGLFFDVSYLITGRYAQLIIVTSAILFIFAPTIWLLQKRFYRSAKLFLASTLTVIMLFTCIYDIHRGQYVSPEILLIGWSPFFVVIFEGKSKAILFFLIALSFFVVQYYEIYFNNLEIDRFVVSRTLVYIVMFFAIYFFINTYKEAFQRLFVHQEKLTDRLERQKENLQKTNASKNRLFSIVAHDLRRPLNLLHGLMSLSPDVLSEQEAKNINEKIKSNLGSVSSMMDNVLIWAKTQLEGFTVTKETFDLNQIIQSEVKICEEEAIQKGISIHVKFDANISVDNDPNLVGLVVRNLINNSVKFTSANGSIDVQTGLNDNKVLIQISDTGIGMDQEMIASIESKNIIPSIDGTQGERGSGLGLSLCQDVLEKIGGQLKIKSEKGKGSEFVVSLPHRTTT